MRRTSSLATVGLAFALVVAACTGATDQSPSTSTSGAAPTQTASTTAPPNPGTLTMAFGDQFLVYRLDECPAPILAGGGSWALADAANPVPAENVDGTEWGIALNIDTGANSFSSVAIVPGGQSRFVGDSDKAPLESRTEQGQVIFAIAFVDTAIDGPNELAAVTTITCDGFSG